MQECYLDFCKLSLPPGISPIARRPQIPFRGTRFFVSPKIADFFAIVDVRIGYLSQTVASPEIGIPASIFATCNVELPKLDSENSDGLVRIQLDGSANYRFGARWRMPTCPPACDITIYVNNLDKQPRDFFGALRGRVPIR